MTDENHAESTSIDLLASAENAHARDVSFSPQPTVTNSERSSIRLVLHAAMPRIARRSFVRNVAFLPALLAPGMAQATLLRGLSLRDLTVRSQHVLLVTPLSSQCSSVAIGGRQMIVTETSARVDALIENAAPSSSTIVVRTLGGVLNGAGLRVHGQAELSIGTACVAFLTPSSDGSLWVTGMAQGHFPLENAASKRYLSPSPHLPELVDFEHSGVRALVGRELSDARRLVREASAR